VGAGTAASRASCIRRPERRSRAFPRAYIFSAAGGVVFVRSIVVVRFFFIVTRRLESLRHVTGRLESLRHVTRRLESLRHCVCGGELAEAGFHVVLHLRGARAEVVQLQGAGGVVQNGSGSEGAGVDVLLVLHDGDEGVYGALAGLLKPGSGLPPQLTAGLAHGGHEDGVPKPAAEGTVRSARLPGGLQAALAAEESLEGELLGGRELRRGAGRGGEGVAGCWLLVCEHRRPPEGNSCRGYASGGGGV
jgi:hypothetical protein